MKSVPGIHLQKKYKQLVVLPLPSGFVSFYQFLLWTTRTLHVSHIRYLHKYFIGALRGRHRDLKNKLSYKTHQSDSDYRTQLFPRYRNPPSLTVFSTAAALAHSLHPRPAHDEIHLELTTIIHLPQSISPIRSHHRKLFCSAMALLRLGSEELGTFG